MGQEGKGAPGTLNTRNTPSIKHQSPTHIVVTGGPCAGKSTALPLLKAHAESLGYNVILVPEAATALAAMGITPLAAHETNTTAEFQLSVAKIQLAAHEAATQAAHRSRLPSIVIHDRGLLDLTAYTSEQESILAHLGLSREQASALYNGVLHFTSAAIDAPTHYETTSNKARRESAAEAAALDEALRLSWSTVSPYWVISAPHPISFETKLSRALIALESILNAGTHHSQEHERKYLITELSTKALSRLPPPKALEQWYIHSKNSTTERRVRASTSPTGLVSYQETIKSADTALTRQEQECTISQEEFFAILASTHSTELTLLRKLRYILTTPHHRFEIDHIIYPQNIWLAEVELLDPTDKVTLPTLLASALEVTGNKDYSNAALAASTPHQ